MINEYESREIFGIFLDFLPSFAIQEFSILRFCMIIIIIIIIKMIYVSKSKQFLRIEKFAKWKERILTNLGSQIFRKKGTFRRKLMFVRFVER